MQPRFDLIKIPGGVNVQASRLVGTIEPVSGELLLMGVVGLETRTASMIEGEIVTSPSMRWVHRFRPSLSCSTEDRVFYY